MAPLNKPGNEALLRALFEEAVASAQPDQTLAQHLPEPPVGRTVVVGVGKAAASMARTVEDHWEGPLSGVVVVPEGATVPLQRIRTLIGSHPVPSDGSVRAGEELLSAVRGLTGDDLVIALVSGGGSALCAYPAAGLTLEKKQGITRELLMRGASIAEINTVRRHLSGIKGGRLAVSAYPAKVITLLISDIPGDDAALIASGPTLADPSSCEDAIAVLGRYGVELDHVAQSALRAGTWESIKPGDQRLKRNRHVVVASAWNGLQAACQKALSLGYVAHILSDAMEGESRELAKSLAAIALSVAQRGTPFRAPCILLSGGEATVAVRGTGRGGRNTEFALAFALAVKNRPGATRIHALSAGTDGLDGNANAAGAWVDSTTLAQGAALGLSGQQHLDNNDSAGLLGATGNLIHTGPTFTNINDFRAILVL